VKHNEGDDDDDVVVVCTIFGIPAIVSATRYHILKNMYQNNGPEETRRDQNGPGRTKRDKVGQKWARAQVGQKKARSDKKRPGRTKRGQVGQKGTRTDQNMDNNGEYGQQWTIMYYYCQHQ
jgi:hypothetical protein